ncbi:hypothetical protein [Streptomyces sennicomposti]
MADSVSTTNSGVPLESDRYSLTVGGRRPVRYGKNIEATAAGRVADAFA